MLKIFVEGKDDKSFIFAYINHLFGKGKINESSIISAGGWNNIDKIVPQFIETTDASGINLVIFDSDESSNYGGFSKRKSELENKRTTLKIEFDLFLFPNNKDDGDFELLLENIINPAHSRIFTCFNNYQSCLETYKDNQGNNIYNLPIRKSKIFAYIDAFKFSNKKHEEIKRGNYFFEESEFWDLNCSYLSDLKKFFEIYIN